MPDFIPRSDNQCVAWSAVYAAGIAADPGRFGVSADDAALLVATQSAFAGAVAVAKSPGTRTPVAIVAKDAARLAMEAVVRRTAGSARAVLTGDRAMLTVLGLSVGPGRNATRTKIGPPKSQPVVFVRQVRGAVVSILLKNTDAPSKRGVARGISGATLFSYVGDVPPLSIGQWRMHRNTSRTDAAVDFGSANPPGTKVWICAQWTSPRSQPGPLSAPVYAYLGYAVVALAPVSRGAA